MKDINNPMKRIEELICLWLYMILIPIMLGAALFIKTQYSKVESKIESESKAEYTLIEKYKAKGTFGLYNYDFIVKDSSGKKKHISVTKDDYLLVKEGDNVNGDGDLIQ